MFTTREHMMALRLFWLQGELKKNIEQGKPKSMKEIYKERG